MNALLSTRYPARTRELLAPLALLQAQVYREARGTRPVPQLMTWLLDRRNLEAAWDRVRSADGAGTPGVDGVTADDLARQGPGWLTRLADELYRRRYRPAAPRWLDVPKPGKPGQTRRLGILTLRDRVVLAGLKQVLEPILDPLFLPTSFGFRPGRSVTAALAEAVRLLTPRPGEALPFSHAAHLDVADCFDTVDHRLLLAELTRHVADPELLRLLELLLQAGGTTVQRWFRRRGRGLVQGSALSPLLCNLALHPVDVAGRDLAATSQDGVRILRYADDLLLLARDARLAERGLACVRTVLGQLQQDLRAPVATPAPVERGVEWLGVRLRPRVRPWSPLQTFGYVIPDGKVAAMLDRLTEMTTPPSERIDAGAFNLGRWLLSINEQLRDWRQAYLFADNAPEVFRDLDEHSRERVAGLLQSVTGARRAVVQEQYRVRLPRGFWTWEVAGTRLVVLSSLAPHSPGQLVHKPIWLRAAAVADRQQAAPPAPPVPQLPAPKPPTPPAEADGDA